MASAAVVILPASASPLTTETTAANLAKMDTASSAEASSRASPLSSASVTPYEAHLEVDTHAALPQLSLDKLRDMSDTALAALNASLAQLSPGEILRWLYQQDFGKVVQFTSFGISGMVITDISSKLGVRTPIVFVDTLHHFDETLALRDQASAHYDRPIVTYRPQTASSRSEFERLYGKELWNTDGDLYAYMTKIEPTGRALIDLKVDVWITGRRRSQGSSRSDLHVLEVANDGRIKCNPMAWVPWQATRQYVEQHSVPYNPLLNRGYKSIGDFHSTVPVGQNAPERSGRWSGDFRTECGMHTAFGRRSSAASTSSDGKRSASEASDLDSGLPEGKTILRLGSINESP
eukprot:m.169898 g.169898  ORF g.169898 m.169898 type:complete len:349 (+) comp16675_c0_seq1:104-1150(+)